ncbi:MAG TPA: head GIN domain-containing protein [Flavisolibacter sp.]|nr:head GIN domain-containing protein [Flavisolibacter sp.]
MRKILLVALAGILLHQASTAQEKQETLEGNGKLVTREVPVSSFDALKASGVYELKLSQGSKETVKIEADENLQELFQVRNEGNKLVIDMKKMENKNLKSKNKMKVYVTFRKIKEMELSTVGNVGSEEQLAFDDLDMKNKSVGNVDLKLTANKIDLKNTSVGNVKLSGKAQDAVVKNSGVGSLEAGSFVVQTMNIENTGIGSAEVNAEKDLKVKDSFMGKVKNKGTAPVRKMNKVRV